MKIIKKDFKKVTIIKPENLDDLWNLKHILGSGDFVKTKTLRTIDALKKEKRPMVLKIQIERIEFDEQGESLRLGGKIVEGPGDISFGHHTLRITPNLIISIEKEWKPHQLIRLKKSLKTVGMKLLICVLDERDADFAVVQEKGIKPASTIHGGGGKQFGVAEPQKYYSEIIKALDEYSKKTDKIIIAGPGFAKDNIFKIIRKEKQELAKKCVLENSSVTGITGINEVIKRGAIERVFEESSISKETRLVEKFLEGLGKESNLVAYGIKEVKKAAELGAIEILLVSSTQVRKEEIEKLMELIEKNKGDVNIIDINHEAGEKLSGLSGLAAFLRFKL